MSAVETNRPILPCVDRICDIMDACHPQGAPHDGLITLSSIDRDTIAATRLTQPSSRRNWVGVPAETFELALEKTVRWYLENQGWWEPLWNGVYNGERWGFRKTA